MAVLAAAESASSSMSDSWVVALATRSTLLVDSVARHSSADCHFASWPDIGCEDDERPTVQRRVTYTIARLGYTAVDAQASRRSGHHTSDEARDLASAGGAGKAASLADSPRTRALAGYGSACHSAAGSIPDHCPGGQEADADANMGRGVSPWGSVIPGLPGLRCSTPRDVDAIANY
jgi:hypothetical protein